MSRAINTITAATAVDGATNLNIDSGTLFVNTTNNNVGIGTTNPATKLDVSGTISASGATGAGVNMLATGTGGRDYRIASTDNANGLGGGKFTIYDQTAGASRVLIDSSGNVGVGTNNPSVASGLGLVLNGGASQTRMAFKNTYTGDTSNDGVQFALVAASSSFIFQNRESDGIFAFETNSVERLRIDSSGNVGIGMMPGTSKLNIFGATGAANATWAGGSDVLLLNNNGAYSEQAIAFQENNFNIGAKIGVKNTANGAYDIIFANRANTSTTSSVTEKMRIDSSGNLLVGTTSVIGNGKISVQANLASGSNGINIDDSASSNGGVFARFSIGSGTLCGFISRNAATSAVLYNTSSDYRLKENVQPMIGALAKVSALKPCTWTWKEAGQAGEGFIAHEIQEIVPNAVSGNKDETYPDGTPKHQGMDASYLVATLTAAIQEQQAIITSLTERITALEAA
jgi:hypothetical protein